MLSSRVMPTNLHHSSCLCHIAILIVLQYSVISDMQMVALCIYLLMHYVYFARPASPDVDSTKLASFL